MSFGFTACGRGDNRESTAPSTARATHKGMIADVTASTVKPATSLTFVLSLVRASRVRLGPCLGKENTLLMHKGLWLPDFSAARCASLVAA